MKWRSVELRLLFFHGLLLLVLGGLFSALTIQAFGYFEDEIVRRDLGARADEVWAIGGSILDDPAQLRELLDRRFSPGGENRFIRISVNGSVLYQSAAPADESFDPRDVPLPRAATGMRHVKSLDLLTKVFRADDGRAILIESGQSGRLAEAIRGNLISALLVGLPVMLLAAGVGGYILIRQAWAPLGVMIRAAEAITFNDPHNRLPLSGAGNRLEVLGQALNRMLDRLDSAYQHASRFSADAAHELRTPLSIIRGELEFIAREPGLSSEVRASLASCLDEAVRLGEMAENLLTLSRMDSVWGKHEHARVNLLELAQETLAQLSLLAEEKNVRLHDPQGHAVFVSGDRGRLKQVLVNLIDNAIKYTPEGGHVRVALAVHAARARLTVKDTGVGIPADQLDDIFRRFYRISTGRGITGSGLGLSIARSICQAHGGTLMGRSEGGGGSSFSVELPAER